MSQEKQTETLVFKGPPLARKDEVTMITNVKIKDIKLNKNSRLDVKADALEGLMQSIKNEGLLQPIGVVKSDKGKYEICYGNRRYLACMKLGMHSIPAIVHEHKKDSDTDLKNLAENIQRRNISVQEVGRYIEILRAEGLTTGEMAARLGVTKGYIETCTRAFKEVPEKFRKDLEPEFLRAGRTVTPGKISIMRANELLGAARRSGLNAAQKNTLFELAKSEKSFNPELVKEYASAIKEGIDPIENVEGMKTLNFAFTMPLGQWERLHVEIAKKGSPFKSIRAWAVSVLNGTTNGKNYGFR